MRVLQIYDHVGKNCGVMSVVMNWYRNIDRSNIQFDFLVSYQTVPSYEEEIRALGGNVFYTSEDHALSIKSMPEIIRNTNQFMRTHAQEYNVVHLHSLTFAYPYLYYAKKYGIPARICHAHSTALGNTRLKSFRNLFMSLPAKAAANNWMACSQIAAEKTYGPLGIKNAVVIPNGIDFLPYDFPPAIRDSIRDELRISKDAFVAIHISNMTAIKNVPFVVRVFDRLLREKPESKLLLVGKNELPEAVRSEIGSRHLAEKVICLGVRSDIPKLLQAADVCLMPSESEGFGLVAVECQLAGIPVITSLGFPEEVCLSPYVARLALKEDLWIRKALLLGGKKTLSSADREKMKRFDISYVSGQISDFYYALGDR